MYKAGFLVQGFELLAKRGVELFEVLLDCLVQKRDVFFNSLVENRDITNTHSQALGDDGYIFKCTGGIKTTCEFLNFRHVFVEQRTNFFPTNLNLSNFDNKFTCFQFNFFKKGCCYNFNLARDVLGYILKILPTKCHGTH